MSKRSRRHKALKLHERMFPDTRPTPGNSRAENLYYYLWRSDRQYSDGSPMGCPVNCMYAPQTYQQPVKEMIKRGWVTLRRERGSFTKYGRRSFIYITPSGLAKMKQIEKKRL